MYATYENVMNFDPRANQKISELIPDGYHLLRSFSLTSPIYLCRENTSGRLVVIKFRSANDALSFKREVNALVSLENLPASSSWAPRLYFAHHRTHSPNEYSYCLGMQYLPGKNLISWQGQLKSG